MHNFKKMQKLFLKRFQGKPCTDTLKLTADNFLMSLKVAFTIFSYRIRDASFAKGPHTGRDSAMRRGFLPVLKSRQICSLQSFIEKFITFQLLESYTFHIDQSFLL